MFTRTLIMVCVIPTYHTTVHTLRSTRVDTRGTHTPSTCTVHLVELQSYRITHSRWLPTSWSFLRSIPVSSINVRITPLDVDVPAAFMT